MSSLFNRLFGVSGGQAAPPAGGGTGVQPAGPAPGQRRVPPMPAQRANQLSNLTNALAASRQPRTQLPARPLPPLPTGNHPQANATPAILTQPNATQPNAAQPGPIPPNPVSSNVLPPNLTQTNLTQTNLSAPNSTPSSPTQARPARPGQSATATALPGPASPAAMQGNINVSASDASKHTQQAMQNMESLNRDQINMSILQGNLGLLKGLASAIAKFMKDIGKKAEDLAS